MTVKMWNHVHPLNVAVELSDTQDYSIEEPLYTWIPMKQTPSRAESILAAGEWAKTVRQLLLAPVFKHDPVLS